MNPVPPNRSLIHSVGVILAVCLGVRLGAELVEPILPSLLTLACLIGVLSLLFRGPRFRR